MNIKNEKGLKPSEATPSESSVAPATARQEAAAASAAADTAAAAGSADEHDALSRAERHKRGERIIQDHVLLGVVTGLIPGPGIDLAVGFAVQLTMLGRLAKVYGVPFRRDIAKNILTSLFGSLGGVGAGGIVASSLIKAV